MNEWDMLLYAEEKGMEDGAACAPYSPPMIWGLFPDIDDAYISAYWLFFSGAWQQVY